MDDRDADIDQGESSAPRDQRIRIGTESVDNEDRASLSSLPPSNKAQDNDASELHARSHSTFFVPSKRSATFLKGILGQRRPKDQVFLNSLKVNAEEVKETRTFERRFNVFKGPLSSYNSIRETYRLIRESERWDHA